MIGREKCDFCKVEMTFVLSKRDYIKAVDEEWAKAEYEYYEQQGCIDDEIDEIEDQLETNKGDELLRKKLNQLVAKKEKLESDFMKNEEKYCNRQDNWKDKRREKLERK